MSADEIVRLVYQKNFESLRKALVEGASLDAKDEDGRTPLMHAVLASDADVHMVEFLLANGATPNMADVRQWTALHFAARDQKLPIVKVLLEAGAVVDSEDAYGNTPLMHCVSEPIPNPELMKALLSKRANAERKNRYGTSPKDIAERMGKSEALALFRDHA